MKNFWIITLVGFALMSCGDEKENKLPIEDELEAQARVNEMSPTEYAKHELRIRSNEKFDLKSYTADCNADGIDDKVITVNLLERAMNNAIEQNKVAKNAELGYLGQYNYLIFRDGKTNEYSSAVVVPSSAQAPLKITFENVRSEFQKDILVDFRIKNACFREYYTILNNTPRLILQLKLFDFLGTDHPEGFVIKYEPGTESIARDVMVYKGTFEQPEFENPDDIYTFEPEITSTNSLERRWFFRNNEFKYFTTK